MGNRIARAVLVGGLAVLAVASAWLLWHRTGAPGERRLVLYLESEGAASRRLYAQFLDRLSARLGEPGSVTCEFVPFTDAGEAMAQSLRAHLARGPVAVVATSNAAASAVRAISATVPLIFATNGDPVAAGLVRDLNRPGGPQTGITSALPTFPKRIEILHEAVPAARRIGVLLDEGEDPGGLGAGEQPGAGLEQVTLVWRHAQGADDIREVIAGRDGQDIDAWYIPYHGLAFQHGERILEALALARRPAIFERTKFADAGALIAYQHTVDDPAGRLADMLASVLEGVRPGEIPVVRPKRFDLVVNLAAARRLGLTLPKSVVKRADRVILDP